MSAEPPPDGDPQRAVHGGPDSPVHLAELQQGGLCLAGTGDTNGHSMDRPRFREQTDGDQAQRPASDIPAIPGEGFSQSRGQDVNRDNVSDPNWILYQNVPRRNDPRAPDAPIRVESKHPTRRDSCEGDPPQSLPGAREKASAPAESKGHEGQNAKEEESESPPHDLSQTGRDSTTPLPCPDSTERGCLLQSCRDPVREKNVDGDLRRDRHKQSPDQVPQSPDPNSVGFRTVPRTSNGDCHVQPAARDDSCLRSDPNAGASRGDPDQPRRGGEDHQTSLAEPTPADREQDLSAGAPGRDEAGGSGGSLPALVITQAEEPWTASRSSPATAPATSPLLGVAQVALRPTDLPIPAAALPPSDPSPCSGDGGDMACSDLLSLRSDTISVTSEATISRNSLFHRVQMDAMEKDWLRSCVRGNISAQRRLLAQDPALVHKKAALHWAAKQGGLEAVDLMFTLGVDVNVRSGYTALHLASIHGHHHIVQALIHTYNAKTTLRDYHGKMAVHYWNGNTDVFNRAGGPPGGKLSWGRRTQRYALPSLLLLPRSRSQGQLNLDFGATPQSPRHEILDLAL